jgi:hypothetical protein
MMGRPRILGTGVAARSRTYPDVKVEERPVRDETVAA